MGCTQSNNTDNSSVLLTKGKLFPEYYALGKKLGAGSFAFVYDCKHKESGRCFAVKTCKKMDMAKEVKEALKMEIKILRMLDHKNVIRFYGNFQDPIAFHLVLELMEGGNLLDNIVRRKRYTEEDARGICKQMFEAVEYCHFHKVVHRDVKPENFLISVQGHSTPKIKLGDFGFATFMFIEDSLEKGPGTPNYVAPEILRAQKYGYAVDMWSLGVCIYQLLRGSLPFRDSNLRNLARQICKQEIKCHDEYWRTMSPLAKNFISLLLERNPKERLTAKEALIHPWMTRTGKNVHLSDTMENLRIYNVKRKLRVAVFTLIAINKFMLFGFQRNVALKGLND